MRQSDKKAKREKAKAEDYLDKLYEQIVQTVVCAYCKHDVKECECKKYNA